MSRHNQNGGDFDDDELLDEYEESHDQDPRIQKKGAQAVANQKYDEAYELSQDLSMAESYDGRDKDKVTRCSRPGIMYLPPYRLNVHIYFISPQFTETRQRTEADQRQIRRSGRHQSVV